MAVEWFYGAERRPTTNSSFNQTSNLILTGLGGGYWTAYSNGTANFNVELAYEYDYLPIGELNAFEAYLATVGDGTRINLPDFFSDFSGSTKIRVIMTGYTKGLSGDSTSRFTVTATFRRVYEDE